MAAYDNKKWNIKCDVCGHFIPASELATDGGASYDFLPDSEVTTETHAHRCAKCTVKHGRVTLVFYADYSLK